MKRLTSALILTLSVGTISACSGPDPAPETDRPDAASPRSEPVTSTMETDMPGKPATDPRIDDVITAARNDLSARRSVPTAAIEIISARRVTWGDGSIGCPEPGMMYTQALVPGYFVHLRINDEDAYYHAGRDGQPRHCPTDRSRPPVDPGDLD
jgi:hypothetical protein